MTAKKSFSDMKMHALCPNIVLYMSYIVVIGKIPPCDRPIYVQLLSYLCPTP